MLSIFGPPQPTIPLSVPSINQSINQSVWPAHKGFPLSSYISCVFLSFSHPHLQLYFLHGFPIYQAVTILHFKTSQSLVSVQLYKFSSPNPPQRSWSSPWRHQIFYKDTRPLQQSSPTHIHPGLEINLPSCTYGLLGQSAHFISTSSDIRQLRRRHTSPMTLATSYTSTLTVVTIHRW